jgi:hypothetical protein
MQRHLEAARAVVTGLNVSTFTRLGGHPPAGGGEGRLTRSFVIYDDSDQLSW